ncbi:uncharacterized protein LOC143534034 [Bidens hawaiensis]|uniref:uncharacterized protein LOC143534034 n=1 Tax=Bidens hawaiensis TaxID=980011 RepID=UPI00404AED0F
MEKENSTDEEPVGFPAPKNVNKVDHEINVPTKNDLSDDVMVGTAADVHEDDQGIKPSTTTTNHLPDHEHDVEVASSNDMEIRSQKDKFSDDSASSSVGISNSENSVSTHAGEPDSQKQDQEKGNSVNGTTLNSTATDIKVSCQKDDSSTDSSLDHKHDEEMVSSSKTHLADAEMEDTSNDMEIRSQEDDKCSEKTISSSSVGLSDSRNSVSTHAGEPDTQKEDQKGNSVNNVTLNSTATGNEISCREDDNCNDDSSSPSTSAAKHVLNHERQEALSSSKRHLVDAETKDTTNDIKIRSHEDDNCSQNSVNTCAVEPNIQKDDKDNSVNDTTLDCTADGNEISDQDDDNPTDNSSSSSDSPSQPSSSENSINAPASEPDIQKENHEKGIIVNDSFSEKECESSSFKETGDIKTDPSDNTSGKMEESLVVYGTQEPKVEAKSSVLTKFVNLCAASNIFRKVSKQTVEDNNTNEKNNNNNNDSSKESSQVVSHKTTPEKPKWSLASLSLIRISRNKSQVNKPDPNEENLESPDLLATKGRILLYTKLWCPKCKEARKILRKRRLRYSEINIDMYPSRKLELEDMTGSSDVPKVFFNQVLVGGLKKLKRLDESGQLMKKIEYVTSEGPSPKAPLPPFSGEDDVASKGGIDELAVIVRKMKGSIVVRDRFYKFRRVTNCFLGSDAVDFLSEDQLLEREGAIEFARKLSKELFFRHVLEENTFEDGNHLYRFLDQDPIIIQCQNIPRGIIQLKRQTLGELSHRLRFLLYAILDAYTSEDGRHIAYRSIHGSEEFARYLRIAEQLQRLDLNKTAKEERLSFFVNLYNLMTIHAILMWGHPEGALDRRKMFNEFKYVIGGCAYSLSDIYNGILRANQRPPYSLIKPFKISDKRFKVALPYSEPLVHFALVSGNRSAPALRCYSPKNIDRELMEAAREFLQSGAFVLDLDSMTISVTKILSWYSVDFGKTEVEILKHAANYLEVEKTQTILELLDSTQLKVVYQPYDWRLNS